MKKILLILLLTGMIYAQDSKQDTLLVNYKAKIEQIKQRIITVEKQIDKLQQDRLMLYGYLQAYIDESKKLENKKAKKNEKDN